MNFETENIEFKSGFTEEIYKEVIAFANTDGGVLYIGIDNDGNAVGLSNVDDEYTRITNEIRDAILPDVIMFVKYTIQENKVVRITISEGTNKPYYLHSKGLKPNGVYVRQGTSSVQASSEQIRQMIKDSDGDDFESMRSLEQELTFASAAAAFESYGVDFSEEKYLALGMIYKNDGLFTNLALLMSDQCQHSIKVAVFGDDENTTFKDNREFNGSIFKQIDEAFRYIMLSNRTSSVFKGLERIDKSDYPEAALREALLNSVVHRDYSYSGSIIININDKQMEFVSIGGLLPGLTADDIRSGISQPRKKNLTEVFHCLKLIEAYGTGIRRIYKLYENCSVQPRIEVTHNTFKMILPNMNVVEPLAAKANLTPQKEQILDFISKKGQITEVEIMNLLGVKRTRAYTVAKQMCDENLIIVVGRGKNKKYLSKE
ncbi:transcriptional regulator [Ruminococcus sp. AF17-11]|nr:RNA-binding domain-containing protein [Ruminococcus sp. AF17-11]RGG84559.1 transcriptional regulator [Ruminococcus sp. AF17-11]